MAESEKRNGPKLSVVATCRGCKHAISEDEGDSVSVYCDHPEVLTPRLFLDPAVPMPRPLGYKYNAWATPVWCPLRGVQEREMAAALRRLAFFEGYAAGWNESAEGLPLKAYVAKRDAALAKYEDQFKVKP